MVRFRIAFIYWIESHIYFPTAVWWLTYENSKCINAIWFVSLNVRFVGVSSSFPHIIRSAKPFNSVDVYTLSDLFDSDRLIENNFLDFNFHKREFNTRRKRWIECQSEAACSVSLSIGQRSYEKKKTGDED